MRLNQSLGILVLPIAFCAIAAASASQLSEVALQSKENATTIAIRANGAFTHTEYRPADNLLLVDLAGVSAAKLENQSRELKGQYPGVESHRIVGYKGASGAEMSRIELTLAPHAVIHIDDAKNSVMVKVTGASPSTKLAEVAVVPAPDKKLETNLAAVMPAPALHAPSAAGTRVAAVVHVQHIGVVRGRDGMSVEITATGPIQPTVLKLTSPDRIVIDLANAIPASRPRAIAVNSGDVKTIRMSHYSLNPPATRIVVDLASAKEYEISSTGNHSVLKLHSGLSVAKAIMPPVANTSAVVKPAEAKNSAPIATQEALTAAYVQPVITTKPAVSESLPAPAPVLRAADAASHFGSAASEIPATNMNASMKPQPAMNLAALQQQAMASAPVNQPLQPASQVTTCASGRYTGEPISVNLKDVDVRDFFRLIHEISGLNVVLDPAVKGSLTLVLDDVPWDQALAIVLRNNGLDCQLEGNVLRIATSATIKGEADARRAQIEAQSLAVETQTITRYLSYAAAKDVVPTLKQFMSQRGNIISDERTNSLIISDIPSTLPNVDRLIRELDRKTQEVEIEARVVAATRNFARDIGTQLGFGVGNSVFALGGNQSTSPITVNGLTPNFITRGGSIPFFSDLGVGGTSSFALTNATNNYRLDFILSLGESRGLLKILSRPRVVTQNNNSANIKQGTRIPVVTGSQLGGPPTVQYIDAFLRLTVKPQITAEGTIFLNVDVENTVPDFSRVVGTNLNPTLITQQATTQVLVSDGGTVVIGGVIQTQNNVAIAQVPLLGNIPILGNLFKRRSVNTNTQELIFFITPKIIQT